MSRDRFLGGNLGHGSEKIENHWFRIYIKIFLQKNYLSMVL